MTTRLVLVIFLLTAGCTATPHSIQTKNDVITVPLQLHEHPEQQDHADNQERDFDVP